jgi:hypothetical protein
LPAQVDASGADGEGNIQSVIYQDSSPEGSTEKCAHQVSENTPAQILFPNLDPIDACSRCALGNLKDGLLSRQLVWRRKRAAIGHITENRIISG